MINSDSNNNSNNDDIGHTEIELESINIDDSCNTTEVTIDSSSNITSPSTTTESSPKSKEEVEDNDAMKEDRDDHDKSKKQSKIATAIYNYFEKWTGVENLKSPPRVAFSEMFWSWLGALVGIGLLAALHYHILHERELVLLIGSFAASAVLIYGAYNGPLSQPRNLIGGHMISAVLGVTVRIIFVDTLGLYSVGCFVSVAFSIVVMQMTRTLHPPGGATAMIAVSVDRLPWAGYQFVLMPVGTGALIMLLVALVVNNMSPKRRYPQYWF